VNALLTPLLCSLTMQYEVAQTRARCLRPLHEMNTSLRLGKPIEALSALNVGARTHGRVWIKDIWIGWNSPQ